MMRRFVPMCAALLLAASSWIATGEGTLDSMNPAEPMDWCRPSERCEVLSGGRLEAVFEFEADTATGVGTVRYEDHGVRYAGRRLSVLATIHDVQVSDNMPWWFTYGLSGTYTPAAGSVVPSGEFDAWFNWNALAGSPGYVVIYLRESLDPGAFSYMNQGQMTGGSLFHPAVEPSGQMPAYEVVDLGPGHASHVNDRNEVVGSDGGALRHAMLWSPSKGRVDLHQAAGWPSSGWSGAAGINRSGQIVAATSLDGMATVLLEMDRTDGTWMSTVVNPQELSPVGINDRTMVVGGELGAAYLWTPTDGLRSLVEDGLANAISVNAHGQILGLTTGFWVPGWENGLHVVVRERDGTLTRVAFFDMGPPPTVGVTVGDLNDRGQVVYTVHPLGAAPTGYRWDPRRGPTPFPGVVLSDINEAGLMVGATSPFPAVITRSGVVSRLPAPDGWTGVGSAEAVNKHGVVVGWLAAPDGDHAVMWIPEN